MRLNTAVLTADGSLAGAPHVGNMWVKIYALMTGTPIYDSRVAGAIATLVETWRIDTGRTGASLSLELTFPAVEATSCMSAFVKGCPTPARRERHVTTASA